MNSAKSPLHQYTMMCELHGWQSCPTCGNRWLSPVLPTHTEISVMCECCKSTHESYTNGEDLYNAITQKRLPNILVRVISDLKDTHNNLLDGDVWSHREEIDTLRKCISELEELVNDK